MNDEEAKPNFERRKGVLTHNELATLLGISRARVFQIEKRALRKLREIIESDPEFADLRDELGLSAES